MNRKGVIKYALFFTVAVLLVILSNHSNKKNRLKYGNDLLFNGIVLKKYVDYKNHNYRIIQVSSSDSNLHEINLTLDNSGLFDYLQDNDSISKKANDLRVYIHRQSFDTSIVINTQFN